MNISRGYDAAQVQRDDDDLDRWRFASDIAELVLATPADWSARIGIFGKWGEGKSTVLHFIESMLHEKGSVVLTFSPWAVQNWNDLWEEFGNHLSEALDEAGIPFEHSWTKGLKASSNWLQSSGVGEFAEGVAGLWGKDKLYNAAFGTLSRWLRYDGDQIRAIREKLDDQRLVVLIDDLDRCAPELIPQLLLSLRELLDLPGFTFILAFDDEVVAESLTQKNPAWDRGADFLDKIFDFRFHLPVVTESQKEKLTARAMAKYCPFVPTDSTKKIEDLLPSNPRKLKSLIRSLAALKPQLARHDPDELNWVDIWLAQMLRLESPRLFERLLKDESLEKEVGVLHRLKQRNAQNNLNNEDGNTGVKGLMNEVGVRGAELDARLIQLLEAARARASLRFRYMCEIALRPDAVTWKEFRLFREGWEADKASSVMRDWISQHAKDRNVSTDEVENELFEAIVGKRSELLQQAAGSNSVTEQDAYLFRAGSLLEMLQQFFLEVNSVSASRFEKVYGQFTQWIGFRKNPGDLSQREREEQLILKLLSSATTALSGEILEVLLPDGWDFDIGDGTLEMRETLRTRCQAIVGPKAAKEAIEFMAREGGIRSLTEPGRFRAVKYCLLDHRSPIWTSTLRDELLGVIRKGKDDQVIYANVCDYIEILARTLQSGGVDGVASAQIKDLLKDEELVRCVWTTVTSKPIQYRMQIGFLQTRQSLISGGALEAALPLSEELNARMNEESQKTSLTSASGS